MDGVEAAHLAGVCHRDLKPENILWRARDNSLVVADFGIAHFEEDEIYTAVETKAASRMANFTYAAPEQRTRGSRVDQRTDIFSLGLMLNELFTKEVPHGSGFRRIKDCAPGYEYLDDLVEAMIQQDSERRPAKIEVVKRELIGRKNAFVSLQEYNAASKRTVSASQPPEFEPVTIINLDYQNRVLALKLNRRIPNGWEREFRQPRGGHSFIPGYGPENFGVNGDMLHINAPESQQTIQSIVDYAKSYVDAANRGYIEQQRELAARKEREERAAMEKAVAEATLRKNVLANVKL